MSNTAQDLTENSAGCFPAPDAAAERGDTDAALIAAAERIGAAVLGPNATDADLGPGPNRANFTALAEAGLLGMALPTEYGGWNASGESQKIITEIFASYCGVTTFTQAQHHGPSRMILGGPNEKLKKRLLPDLAAGKKLCAVSFAHLRRPGPPVLRAEPINGGWRLFGTAPWVTGYGLMNQCVFGATLPDGRHIYLWSPFDRADFPDLFEDVSGPPKPEWGTLTASPPLPLCAMNASATVEMTLDGWFIPAAHWLSESDRETMRRNDRNNISGATAMPLGCAKASIRLLCETGEHRHIAAVLRAAESLRSEWAELRDAIEFWSGKAKDPDGFERALETRAWCIEFANRAALAAVSASSGGANSRRHPAQRLLREAMFYAVQAQTQEVMESTLKRLTARTNGATQTLP